MSEEEKKENELLNNSPNEEGNESPAAAEIQAEPVFRVEAPIAKSEEKSAENVVEELSNKAENVAEELSDKAENVAEAAESQGEAVVEAVSHTVEAGLDKAGEAVKSTVNTAGEAASEIGEKLEDKAEQVIADSAEKAKEVLPQAKAAVEAAAAGVSASVSETAASASASASEAAKKLEEKVEEKLSAADRIKQNVNKHKPVEKARGDVYEKDASGKNHSAMIVGLAVGILLLVLALGYAFFPRRTKINLDKYVSVSFSGYDGYGKGEVSFDEESFLKDLKKKVKLKKKKDAFTDALFKDYSPEAFLYDFYISGNWSLDGNDGNYKNGDKVHLTWAIDKDMIEEDFKVKIKDAGQEFTVKDLEKMETFDAFADLDMKFVGTAPDGTAEWQGSELLNGSNGLYLTVDPQYGLSNGDKVTVKIGPKENLNNFIQKTGKAPKEMEKVFTVEGLSAYIDSSSKIDDALLGRMKGEVEDLIQSNIAKEGDTVQLLSSEYIGYYFLNAKSKTAFVKNIFYPVYKVSIRITLADQNFAQDYSFYTSGAFRNIMEDGNGKADIDVSEMRSLYNSFVIDTGVGNWFTTKYYIDGFETLESLKSECITKNLSEFKAEEKISETATAQPETSEAASQETAAGENAESESTGN